MEPSPADLTECVSNHLHTLQEQAHALREKGDWEMAELLYRQDLEAVTSFAGPEHPDALEACYHLASLLADREQWPEALALMERAAAGMTGEAGVPHPQMLNAVQGLEKIRSHMAPQ